MLVLCAMSSNEVPGPLFRFGLERLLVIWFCVWFWFVFFFFVFFWFGLGFVVSFCLVVWLVFCRRFLDAFGTFRRI